MLHQVALFSIALRPAGFQELILLGVFILQLGEMPPMSVDWCGQTVALE